MPVRLPDKPRTVLRDLIDAKGLRYEFVARKMGLSSSMVTRLMNAERTLQARDLAALEELLGVPHSAFFDGRELLISKSTTDETQVPPEATARPVASTPNEDAPESVQRASV